MATRTKEEFEQMGYTHASNGDVRSYKSDSTSWQGIAYNAGVQRYTQSTVIVAARCVGKSLMREFAVVQPAQQKPKVPVKVWFDELVHDTPANRWSTEPGFVGWPVGAVAHVKDLQRQLLVVKDIKREVRLLNALTRLKRRHGARA